MSVTNTGGRKPDRNPRRRSKKRRLMMEDLERRQLLAVLTEPPTLAPTDLPTFTTNRNVGTVPAFIVNEGEPSTATGENDLMSNADFLDLGTAAGKEDTIDLSGSLPITEFLPNLSGFSADIDTYSFDLRAGDILDIATLGAAGTIRVRDSNGSMIVSSDVLIAGGEGPLQDIGNATAQVVIPEDGRYFLTVAPLATLVSANYTVGLRTYRPTTESLAVGDTQILYIDFHGDLIDNNIFNQTLFDANPGLPVGGNTFVRSLADSLPVLGLELGDTVALNSLIDSTVSEVIRVYEDLVRTGGNGDIESPNAQPGDYGLRVLNSRDHRGSVSFDDPRVSRLLVGGTGLDIGVPGVFGIAQSVDIGNFDLNELGVFALDAFGAEAIAVDDDGRISPSASQVDFIGKFLGNVAAHEAGHVFGMIHTNNSNSINTVSDAGGTAESIDYLESLGNDRIFGTLDDIDPIFRDDFYQPGEVPDLDGFAINRVTSVLAHSLSSGTVGSTSSARVFLDANRDGNGNSDPGLAGVTIFADINGNGTLDAGEPTAVSGANGEYSLAAPSGSTSIVAITPANHIATTPTSSTGTADFGFFQVLPDVTGTTYADVNGNFTRDAGEGPVADVYVYLDLDGDDRPDLGEPNARSGADGTYSLNFPGTGTYTVRIVVPPGFEQTEPVGGEHTVTFDGSTLSNNAFFGLLPSTDFGDAPASYGEASHGRLADLYLGATAPDREVGSFFSATATGDDLNATDDEDGVSLISPLGPGGTATFSVDVTNSTGATAYLQGFIDFDADGTFSGAGEQFAVNLPIGSSADLQTIPVTVSVPSFATIGDTIARFRLSPDLGVGATGFADGGEVEDYQFSILPSVSPANDDPDAADPTSMTVSRNSVANVLDVLANDFQTPSNQLTIVNLNTVGTVGQTSIAADGKSVLYTPPNGFVGLDFFSYTVEDEFGILSTANVTVTVQFQSENPIAVDDSFEVPEGSSNRALNVLANDVPSTAGGISVISVTSGSAGGFLSITGGGQSLRYTPLPGFNGTEQFTYTIQDGAGNISSAIGTVHLLPGAAQDDIVFFSIELLDEDGQSLNGGIDDITPSVRVGETFQVRVLVDDLRDLSFGTPEGVASASLDLLYSSALVAVEDAIPGFNNGFPFDITFGQIFGGLQDGDALTPGLIDDVGAIQTSIVPQDQVQHSGPAELFTLTMQAVAPGVAQFIGDPSENPLIETAVIGSDTGLTPSELGYDRAELLILPQSTNFTSAVEDSFPLGLDSNGNPISSGTTLPAELRILDNDNLRIVDGQEVSITQFGIVSNPSLGTVTLDNNGTPTDFNDDFVNYRPFVGANGLEQFSYFIVDDEGSSSVAQVTIALGNQNATAEVAMDFQLVREDGSPIDPNTETISVGERVGVQIILEDLTPFPEYVFAGYLDVLYSTGVLAPATDLAASACTVHNGSLATELGFSACIGNEFVEDATSGSVSRPGLINEFGSNSIRLDDPDGPNPALLATIFFDAVAPGTGQVTGSPADRLPESDTVVFGNDDPIDVANIRYDSIDVNVVGSTLQNASFPQDVDADGEATALDALIIVNRLGDLINGENPLTSNGGFYTDVNGDFKVTAIDALQVINYISRSRGRGEAESTSQPVQIPTTQATAAETPADESDAVFAELATDGVSKIVAADSSSGQSASNPPIIMSADDDDDDGLDLFADDVFDQWN